MDFEMSELTCCQVKVTPAPLLFPAAEVPQIVQEPAA